jgi:creatinine amidohydrolase/Fe(II)-dependent formamide hydrolase-like protein
LGDDRVRKYDLAYMSYPEIAAINKDDALLLIPIGCVEQHGPCGYVGADAILAHRVALEAASALSGVYVTPPIWFGYTPYTAFAGTVSLRQETLHALVEDVVYGYIAHGFRHICIVNNHGPNEAAIEPVASKVRKERGIVIGILYPWMLANHVAVDLYPDSKAVYGHGGEPTISVMMAMSPGSVTLVKPLKRGYVSPEGPLRVTSFRAARFEGFQIGLYNAPKDVLPSGASGDWSVATEERGREILKRMIKYAVDFLPEFLRYSKNSQAQSAGV